MSTQKQKILIITGPTASGKSSFAVELAKKLNGEIVGADSVQIFKRLNIGSGKIKPDEMNGIKHHMLDILEPWEEYSVSDYILTVKKLINDLTSRQILPIIVGGTGLYIKCLLEGHNFAEAQKDETIREKLKQILLEKGKEYLYEQLKIHDAESANKISINDTKRVIRALEIFELTGTPKSKAAKQMAESEYDFKMLILNRDRDQLYEEINMRVDKMFDFGLIEEVNSLIEYKDCQSMQSIGYKETVEFLSKKRNLEETKSLIKQNTRHYAKRQLTFFRGMKCEKQWVDAPHSHVMSDIT